MRLFVAVAVPSRDLPAIESSYSAGFAIASVVLTESIHAAYFVSEHGHNIHLVIGHEESVAY